MTQPTLVGFPVASVGGSGVATYPSGMAIGDVCFATAYGGTASTAPAGFSTITASAAGTLGVPNALYYRVIDGSEGSTTPATGNSNTIYTLFALRGLNTGGYYEAVLAGASATPQSNVTSYAIPSSTSTVDDSWQIVVCFDGTTGSNSVSSATGYTQLGGTINLGSEVVALFRKAIFIAGASGAGTVVLASTAYGDVQTFVARGIPTAPSGLGKKSARFKSLVLQMMAGVSV